MNCVLLIFVFCIVAISSQATLINLMIEVIQSGDSHRAVHPPSLNRQREPTRFGHQQRLLRPRLLP